MKKLKQTVLVVVSMFAATTFSFSQSYSITPNDTFVVNAMMEDLETLTIKQVNNIADTLYLQWEKVSESVPDRWEASVCDNQFCYATLIDSGSMNPIFPNDYSFLLLHITAHVIYGTATIRYAVWDVNFPKLKDTVTFIMNVNAAGITKANIKTQQVWFAENIIHFRNTNQNYSSLTIVDLNGKEIFNTSINNKLEIEIPILPTSLYIIRLTGKQKQFTQKIFIQE